MTDVQKIEISNVDRSLYPVETITYASVSWIGHQGEGFFVVDAENVDGVPMPYWSQESHVFGKNPSAPATEVWKTSRLRGVIIGERSRFSMKDDLGNDYFYPYGTPPEQVIDGKYTSHVQVLMLIDGLASPVAVSLSGKYRTVSWNNNPKAKNYDRSFPVGVKPQLIEYSKRASKQQGEYIPWMNTWVVDLVPLIKNGEPYMVESIGSFNNPFTLDMRTGGEFPASRYVGPENFDVNQALRREIAIPWEAEWKTPAVPAATASIDTPEPEADDDWGGIPF